MSSEFIDPKPADAPWKAATESSLSVKKQAHFVYRDDVPSFQSRRQKSSRGLFSVRETGPPRPGRPGTRHHRDLRSRCHDFICFQETRRNIHSLGAFQRRVRVDVEFRKEMLGGPMDPGRKLLGGQAHISPSRSRPGSGPLGCTPGTVGKGAHLSAGSRRRGNEVRLRRVGNSQRGVGWQEVSGRRAAPIPGAGNEEAACLGNCTGL